MAFLSASRQLPFRDEDRPSSSFPIFATLSRLPSLFATPHLTAVFPKAIFGRSPRHDYISPLLGSQMSPPKEKDPVRLPSIRTMMDRDTSPCSSTGLYPIHKHYIDSYKQLNNIPMVSHPESFAAELSNRLVASAVNTQPRKICRQVKADMTKRNSHAKLCGIKDCRKRAKAGGCCIAHGGGLRCSESECKKHAVSLGLCISHGGGKRCNVKECHNASRKNGVCWTHGGKRQCKIDGCNKGPKSGGFCWSHGGRMRKDGDMF
ncbi:hypothetical protein CCR75_006600 [Bremia lactucae]|uniref:WRKY19-like zinc finger domain-containing protein n=1 Tax=Bremia lactucae TaxID=4779 RepID=A0A976IGX0_BRELC|nr:hypothetical protein CCR75_006600 [Bremia lactucae]